MHNLRLEGDEFVYDCDGIDCPTPGESHRISVNAVCAALEVSYREFMYHLDPRAEAVDVALQYIFQAVFKKTDAAPMGERAPWGSAFEKLVVAIDGHYSEDEPPRRKDLLN